MTAVGQWSAVKAAQKVQSAVKYTIWSTVRLQCGTIQSRYGYVHMDNGQHGVKQLKIGVVHVAVTRVSGGGGGGGGDGVPANCFAQLHVRRTLKSVWTPLHLHVLYGGIGSLVPRPPWKNRERVWQHTWQHGIRAGLQYPRQSGCRNDVQSRMCKLIGIG